MGIRGAPSAHARRTIISAPVPEMRIRLSPPALRTVARALGLVALATALVHAQAAPAASPRDHEEAALGRAMLETIHALTGPAMQGRAAGSEGGAAARAWIEQRLTALHIPPAFGSAYARPFTFTTKAGVETHAVNLAAVCQGRQADAGTIVVSAHYDHLGVRDGQVYHGADDNASGVSMLLHVAERCVARPYRHTLVLAFFDAEEAGLQGARAFLADPAVEADRLRLNVNFDMVGRSDRREIYIAGPGRWPALRSVLAATAAAASVVATFGHDTGGGHEDWTSQSDHGVFHEAGIPFVYFGVEDHADYHRPTDTPDKISPAFLGGVATLVLDSLGALDRASAYK